MDLKKIMALAMVVLLALPSLTMVVRADEPDDPDDGVGLAGAIERARLYLDNVVISAENLALEYHDNEDVLGYLNEIYELIDQNGEEDPEFLLKSGTYGIAELSDVESYLGTYSVHLETTGTPGDGDEARIVIPMPEGFTLEQLDRISWWEFLVDGYPPHVDVILDMGEGDTDALVFEYAYNDESHAAETWPTYGALTDAWYKTFSDDGNGPSVITETSKAWLSSGAPGPLAGAPTFYYHTLGEWKSPGYEGVSSATPVLRLEIEVDNWIVQTEAYVDDVKVDGFTYDFEEKLEDFDLGAEGFLNQASAYLEDGEVNLAARSLASARNILGRVKGLLDSMVKIHKVARTERFMQMFEHRIAGLEDKIDRLRGRFGEGNANNAAAAMGQAKGKLGQLGADLSEDNVNEVIDELDTMIASINTAIDDLGGDTSDILEAIDRLEAKIRALKALSDRLAKKGMDTSDVDEELDSVKLLLDNVMNSLVDGDTEEAENLLKDAGDLVSEASKNIRGIRNQNKGKGNKDSKPGKKNK